MTRTIARLDPRRFGLQDFADLLPQREPMIGEDPLAREGFRLCLLQTLDPATPYEMTIAESLVAVEWEIVQRRRMLDDGLRQFATVAIIEAVVASRRAEHDERRDADLERHLASGGDEGDWDCVPFDRRGAEAEGRQLALEAHSVDPGIRQSARETISTLGLSPLSLMSEAYAGMDGFPTGPLAMAARHDARLRDLERRRRDLMRDYETARKLQAVEARVVGP